MLSRRRQINWALAFFAGTAIGTVALLIWIAYVSISTFRHDTTLREKTKPQSIPRPVRAVSSIETGRVDVSDLYIGPHVIVVCSELEVTQKPQTSCP
jgi:hypothetical protein